MQDSTIPSFLNYLVGFFGPLLVVIGVELHIASGESKKRGGSDSSSSSSRGVSNLPTYANIINLYLGYLLAAAINQVTAKCTNGQMQQQQQQTSTTINLIC